jgi:hypothetical protein
MNINANGGFQIWDMNKSGVNLSVSSPSADITSMINNFKTLFNGRSLAYSVLSDKLIAIGKIKNSNAFSIACSIFDGNTVDFGQLGSTNLVTVTNPPNSASASYSIRLWDVQKCQPENNTYQLLSSSTSWKLTDQPLSLKILNDTIVAVGYKSKIEIRRITYDDSAVIKNIPITTGDLSQMHLSSNNLFASDSKGNIYSYPISSGFSPVKSLSANSNFLVIDDDRIVSWNKITICSLSFSQPDSKNCVDVDKDAFLDLQLVKYNNDNENIYLIGSTVNSTSTYLKVINFTQKKLVDVQNIPKLPKTVVFKFIQLNKDAIFNPSKIFLFT